LLLLSSLEEAGTESDCFSSEGGREAGSLGLLADGRGGGGRGPLAEEEEEEDDVVVEEEEASVSGSSATVGVEGSTGEDESICVVERTLALSPVFTLGDDDDGDDERSSEEVAAGVSNAWSTLSSTITTRGVSLPFPMEGRFALNEGALLAPRLRPTTLALPKLRCSSF